MANRYRHSNRQRRIRLILLLATLLWSAGSAENGEAQMVQEISDTTYVVTSESYPLWSLGLFPGTSLESWSVSMSGLPGIPSCCPAFQSGSGTALRLMAEGSRNVSDRLRLTAGVGYTILRGTFETIEEEFLDNGSGGETGEILHTIDLRGGGLDLRPLVEYSPLPQLWIGFGPVLHIALQGSFEQEERLIAPENITFENMRRTRLEIEGPLPEQEALQLAISSHLRYELPLDSASGLALIPSIGYDLGLTEGISGVDWKRQGVRLGLGLRMLRSGTRVVDIDTIITRRVLDSMVAEIPSTEILVNVMTEHENAVETIDSLHLDVVRTTTLVPLLDNIFFDNESAEIPERYVLLEPKKADRFSEASIGGEAFDIYYRILDIVGRRLRDNPEATITLTGCNSGFGNEDGNLSLSRDRAEAIRDHLRRVWSIDSARLIVKARNLPSAPSPVTTEDGRSENRRVELSSNHPDILAPVMTHDTAVRPNRSVIFFEVENPESFVSWNLEARQGDRVIMREKGTGTPPQKIPLAVASGATTLDLSDAPIRFWLKLVDSSGVERSDDGEIAVTRSESVRQGAEAYWMIVFGYNRRELRDGAEETIARVADWISAREGHLVELVGQTDRTGDDDYNRRLSRDRAEAVSTPLGASADIIRAVGNTLLEYPNDLPEGRYYSRNVKIVTRTDE